MPLSVYTKPRELIHSIDEVTPVQIEINAPSLERAVIQRVIRDEELQNELSSIAERLRDRKELDFYTDGLLVVECEEGKEAKRIGVEWVVASDKISESSISFKSRIVEWLSSTRSEERRVGKEC